MTSAPAPDGCWAGRALPSCVRGQGEEAPRASLRAEMDNRQAQGDEDAGLLLARTQATGSTDPLACLCCCKLKRLGHSYILHERWNGKLLLVGPHWVGVVCTVGILFLSTGMFLIQHVALMPWYDTLVTLGLCGMTLYYLFQTTCSDPGIVQSEEGKEVSLPHDEVDKKRQDQIVEMQSGQPSRHPSRTRYCDLCSIDQDRSMEHCEDCGVCIAGYDHHCPWMGKCIGRGNIHAFKMFNVSWVVYVAFVLFISITSTDWRESTRQTLQRP
ncbi:hypothetical protein PsorP6_000513 [Peronosclerospora sorghi]|uniref:Uncharacterized protein n=1 Tax=Peronosclerospora sorghi TaxID=230839 RepID=A0ACC0WS92_9STRA|nr:hypothetical protein PsorP6_000513 [Peronosclerospora sorghi]